MRYLLDLLDPELSQPATDLYPHNLAGILETAIRSFIPYPFSIFSVNPTSRSGCTEYPTSYLAFLYAVSCRIINSVNGRISRCNQISVTPRRV